MAEQITPTDDPIVSRSFTVPYLICTILLVASLFWALWDEAYGERPWKHFQNEFQARYSAYLKTIRSDSSKDEKDIKETAEYKELENSRKAAEAQAKPAEDQIHKKLDDLNNQLAAVQGVFTDARAHVTAAVYEIETSGSASSRDRKLKDLDAYKQKKQFVVPGEQGQEYSFLELEAKYNDLKTRKADAILELSEADKPVKDALKKETDYLADHMVNLSAAQIRGLQDKTRAWDSKIIQINVPEANLVDRCESCHMGIREPVTIVAASMKLKNQKGPDEYARAFTSHPARELLAIHDPEKFGCVSCHGGNGRATSSVEKAHGKYEHWLFPLYEKENIEAGCQSCHAADMFLAKGVEMGASINEGKDLFRQRGCVGCHRFEGYDREPEDVLSIRQQIKQLETTKKANLKEAAQTTAQADKATDNTEARNLYQHAEALKVDNSNIDGKIEQLDFQSRNVLRDMKKVGPNLKEIRAKLNPNWIPVWLRKPTDFRPTTKMPNFRLKEEQIQAIAAYLWQSAIKDEIPKQNPGNALHGKELFETRGCMACHSIGEGSEMTGGTFAANLSRVGEKDNYDYLVRWIHNPRQRMRPYSPYERKDLGPEDYAKKGLPFVFDLDNSTSPNDGHAMQVQQMTVMPILRLSPEEAADIASYLVTQKKKEPADYPVAAFLDDPNLKEVGRGWIRHYGCAGCHEISGFEDEGRIGTELTAEGSKPIERLDFALLTHDSEYGGKEPITDATIRARLPDPDRAKKGSWYDRKGFFEHKLAMPDVFDLGKIKGEKEVLRMPDPHLTPEQIRALTTFLLGSQDVTLPASYIYRPEDSRRDVQDGWWVIKKYNCMGCHQFVPGQMTTLMANPRYQDADGKEQLPPKLLTEGARVDPTWMAHFLANPALDSKDLNRNGVRTYLRVRMPTFNLSSNEIRKLVKFFQAKSQQPQPYIPAPMEVLTAKEQDMARSLFTSTAAPCLKCHATGNPAHDKTATAPNFLLAKDRLKPGWTERWIIDPQAISPGTSMPSGLFRRDNDHWVFSGPTPASFQGYDQDQTKLLVRYIFQLTPEEQRRASAAMAAGGNSQKSSKTATSIPGKSTGSAMVSGGGQ